MNQWRPLRVVCVGLQGTVGRVVSTNIQCWGYEVITCQRALRLRTEEHREEQTSVIEGDILLYDLDTALDAEGNGGALREGYAINGLWCSETQQWLQARLTIALSCQSVSRSRLERIGAVALLQKPFEMGHLQRYLRVLEHLLMAKPEERVLAVADQEKVRVLVVDDNVDIAHAIRQYLLYETGYEVAVAYDGLEALEQCIHWHPECIVTDLIMPWMNGYQILRCLAAGEEQTMPGLVVMSALPSWEEPEKHSYLEGKSVVYVKKPFHIDRLLNAIRQVCAE